MGEVDRLARLSDVMRELQRFYSAARIQVDPPGAEWDRAEPSEWSIIVTPHGEEELSRTMRVAARFVLQVRVGGTHSIGQRVLAPDGVLRIDTTGMGRLLSIDHVSGLVTVQAGTSIAVLSSRLAERRMMLGWSMAWTEPRTLGAVLAGAVEDRWGPAYGSAFSAVRAMSLVLPDGSRAWSRVAPRRATGPDLTHVAQATAGTVAVIASATLRVFPRATTRLVLSGTSDRPAEVLRSLERLLAEGSLPHLVELYGHPDGITTVLLSIRGDDHSAKKLASEATQALGMRLAELQSLPAPVQLPEHTGKVRMTFPQVIRVMEQWTATESRCPIRIDRFSTHSALVSCPGEAPFWDISDIGGPLAHTTRSSSVRYLQRLKAVLDENNLLGSL